MVSYASMESFIAAKILVEAIQRSGADPTRQKIITQLDKMNSYDVGGFKVSFSPDNHVGSKFVEVTVIGRDGKLLTLKRKRLSGTGRSGRVPDFEDFEVNGFAVDLGIAQGQVQQYLRRMGLDDTAQQGTDQHHRQPPPEIAGQGQRRTYAQQRQRNADDKQAVLDILLCTFRVDDQAKAAHGQAGPEFLVAHLDGVAVGRSGWSLSRSLLFRGGLIGSAPS